MPDSRQTKLTWLVCLVLGLVTLAVYWPVTHAEFVDYDDPSYVLQNPHVQSGLTRETISWAFASGYASNWHPLTWISHMIDCQLFGLKPAGHHVTSLLFHVANTLLLFGVLRSLTGAFWRSAMVAALFAWHPLHVESVAWVAERKDVLSTFFGLLTLWAYSRYARKSKVQSPKSKVFYCLALVFFALGLMSKPMLVTLPFVLLLLDFWPLQRFQISNLKSQILEKAPFFLLSIACSIVTCLVQKSSGAVASLTASPISWRLANVPISYVQYLRRMIAPTDLTAFYPQANTTDVLGAIVCTIGLLVLTAFVLHEWRRGYLITGWFWFLGMLMPVIGLVQVGSQSMADRYTYLPAVGIFIIWVWGFTDKAGNSPMSKLVFGTLGAAALAGCLVATSIQVRYWQTTETLWRHALDVTKDNPVANTGLGMWLSNHHQNAEGLVHLKEAARLHPNDAETRYQLALGLAMQGDQAAAIEAYREALRLNPDWPVALNDLAWILATSPKTELRNGPEAVRLAERACQLTENRQASYLGTLDAAYAEAGRFPEAIATAEKTKQIAAQSNKTLYLIDAANKRLELYRSGRPYRTP